MSFLNCFYLYVFVVIYYTAPKKSYYQITLAKTLEINTRNPEIKWWTNFKKRSLHFSVATLIQTSSIVSEISKDSLLPCYVLKTLLLFFCNLTFNSKVDSTFVIFVSTNVTWNDRSYVCVYLFSATFTTPIQFKQPEAL